MVESWSRDPAMLTSDWLQVVRKVVHPKYNFFTYENDLALVKTEKRVR